MHSAMNQDRYIWSCLANFYAFHGSFFSRRFLVIGLDHVWGMMTCIRKCEETTSWPEIWWHDAMYHEVNHHLKWPNSANVRIFLSRPAEGAVILWMSRFSSLHHICCLATTKSSVLTMVLPQLCAKPLILGISYVLAMNRFPCEYEVCWGLSQYKDVVLPV